MFGSTATISAVISPTRRPAISRPASPQTAMVAAPTKQDQIRAAKKLWNPKNIGTVSTNVHSGGHWAVCRITCWLW